MTQTHQGMSKLQPELVDEAFLEENELPHRGIAGLLASVRRNAHGLLHGKVVAPPTRHLTFEDGRDHQR